ncbi:collagen-binding domain-containing protein [Mangrovicoccus sp. HB161399]|uniref:collagen-binding domain-containing protein n=1 Tax=Mangrovicoccus sp. HB161399 TaxID=2720392 RepID=UPI001556006E
MTLLSHRLALAAALAAGIPAIASAASLDALGLLQSFNVIALDDADMSAVNHVEGTVYVGGDLTSGTFIANQDNLPEAAAGSVTGGLIVGGDLNAHVNSGGNGAIQVGGSLNGSSDVPVNTGVTGIPVSEMADTFTSLAAGLSQLSGTDGAAFDTTMNFKSFSSGAGTDGIAVLNLGYDDALAMFTGAGQISFDIDASVTAFIINVAGADFGSDWSTTVWAQVNSNVSNVLFNFYEADTLTFGSTWNASVLAPGALLASAPGGMNGTVVAEDLVLKGEIRTYGDSYVYAGTLPEPAAAAVPLPAALPLSLAGLCALGLVARRRRSA